MYITSKRSVSINNPRCGQKPFNYVFHCFVVSCMEMLINTITIIMQYNLKGKPRPPEMPLHVIIP